MAATALIVREMLTSVTAGPFTIKGLSLGGIYTSLYVQELDALLDVGLASRHTATARNIFLSHAHADHMGALGTLMGLRGLYRCPPPRLFLPAAILDHVKETLAVLGKLQHHPFEAEFEPMNPGDERALRPGMVVRAFKTHHPVPSLGYEFVRKTTKLRPEWSNLSGPEIARRKAAGEFDALFFTQETSDLAYATDTLLRVIDTHPALLSTRVLIMECSFLDERKDLADSRAGCHVHLTEVLERADEFQNEALVLMHFSQLYEPDDVRAILQRRCPPKLLERIVPFVPSEPRWNI